MIRVVLPLHLRTLAKVEHEVTLEIAGPVTTRTVVEAIEERFPMLNGTIREHGSGKRRPRVRFYVCGEDVSHQDPDKELPAAIADGEQAFMVVGAISGG